MDKSAREDAPSAADDSQPGGDTSEPLDFDRWAQLVADGQTPWPTDWSAEDWKSLARRVADLRRQRLLRFFARLIAREIWRESEQAQRRC